LSVLLDRNDELASGEGRPEMIVPTAWLKITVPQRKSA
jgi:hypothetical protein